MERDRASCTRMLTALETYALEVESQSVREFMHIQFVNRDASHPMIQKTYLAPT